MYRAFVLFNATVARWCMYAAVLGLVGIVATVGYQVFGRYVMNDTPTWAEALANAEVITDGAVRHYETTKEHALGLGTILAIAVTGFGLDPPWTVQLLEEPE